jgi:hypothetical protein
MNMDGGDIGDGMCGGTFLGANYQSDEEHGLVFYSGKGPAMSMSDRDRA